MRWSNQAIDGPSAFPLLSVTTQLSPKLANALSPEAKAEIDRACRDSDPEIRALAEKLRGMME